MKGPGISPRLRIKWEFSDAAQHRSEKGAGAEKDESVIICELEAIKKIISENLLKTYFQPVIDTETRTVFGYEALTRMDRETPFRNVAELFQRAIQCGCVGALDSAAFQTALSTANFFSFKVNQSLLFINLCPETLMDNGLFQDTCDTLTETLGFPRDSLVLEITEESIIPNYELFKHSLEKFRAKGYRIGIDDFGAGYGGLKLLAAIEPDFVKIDRNLISDIDRAIIKFNLVDAIATVCNRIGITAIAEGVEREEECRLLRSTGIRYLQGYYLEAPNPEMTCNEKTFNLPGTGMEDRRHNGEPCFIGDIAIPVEPISPDEQIINALKRFTARPELSSLPVVKGHRVVGMLHRSRFIENHIIGRHGYGYSMNTYKRIADIMENDFLICESNTTFEELSRRIQSRTSILKHDDICVTQTGKYFGTVAISLLLSAITERHITLAKGCNPLSGLPGNDFIQREISLRLTQNMHFDVSYIDIDNFKPFNDHYGFEKGDLVIRKLASIITEVLSLYGADSFNFAGHIGGDDFILVTRPQISLQICEEVISRFKASLECFHGEKDMARGGYEARNRKGEIENFQLLSLSIGIVSTEVYKIDSYPELASRATEVKKKAKMDSGFSIVRDQRLSS